MENHSYFDGGLLQLIGWRILGFVVTVCTLGRLHDLWLGDTSHGGQRPPPRL